MDVFMRFPFPTGCVVSGHSLIMTAAAVSFQGLELAFKGEAGFAARDLERLQEELLTSPSHLSNLGLFFSQHFFRRR